MKKTLLFLFLLAFTFVSALAQQSLMFRGSTATYATVADNPALNVAAGQSATIIIWVKTTYSAGIQVFLAKRLNAAGPGYEFFQLNGFLAVNCTHTNGSSSGLPGGSKYRINDGKWHQLAFVVDNAGGNYYMYVDGKLEVKKALVSTSGISNTDKLYVGIRGNLQMPTNGAIDEVRIYNKALTPAELLVDMAATVTAGTSGLAAAWNFEEGAGAQAADVKGVCTASLVGTPEWEVLGTPGSQVITMNGPISVAKGAPGFSPATSTSPMPIQYTSSNPEVAVVVDGEIKVVGQGTSTLTARQQANLFYAASEPVTQTLTVSKTLVSFGFPLTSNAVIQRDRPIRVTGTAEPDDELTVVLDGESKSVTVDAAGNWTVEFAAKPAKNSPFTLSAEGAGSELATLTNLLCGDVWVASGQSNMLMPVGPGYSLGGIADYSSVVAAANYPAIRFIQPVDLWQQASAPQSKLSTSGNGWTVCSPSTVAGYSAVAYFFARQIHLDRNIPIGIIQNAIGGTRVEAWTPLAALQSIPEYASWYTKAISTTLPSAQVYDRKNFPAANFNGMLAPYTRYPVKGIIWYQGEENLGIDGIPATNEYGNKMKATIQGWRAAWGIADLPVIFTELANYKYSAMYSVLGGSREALPRFIAQQQKATQLPGVYGITISDVSNYNDIHPTEKATVGIRMGNTALGYVYGKDIVPTAATFKEMKNDGSRLRVSFNNAKGFRLSTGTSITEFKIAGPDKVFKAATAVIDGDDILLSEATIQQPVAVKFAWDENSNPNLVNGSNSPTARFTDSLKVNRISFETLPQLLTPGMPDVTLQATATSGAQVVFTSSNPEVAEIVNGNRLRIKLIGTAVITASEPGSTVYAAALPVRQEISVIYSGLAAIGAENIHIQPVGNRTFIVLNGLLPDTVVEVRSADGKLVMSRKAGSESCKLEFENLSGLHILKLTDKHRRQQLKFIP